LQVEGYRGAYGSVQRFVKHWKAERQSRPRCTQAFAPLRFRPGETGQFDWSHEQVELGGSLVTVKLAHFRLPTAARCFWWPIRARPRKWCWTPMSGPSPFSVGSRNAGVRQPEDVVDAILIGKERRFNRRFLALANHYLFEPVACTPEAGWEKGQVENQVGNVREWLFTPRPCFAGFAELNAWLEQRCRELAQRPYPTEPGRSIADCFAEEQLQLRPITAPFEGYVEHLLRVSSTCLVRIDRNRYSVPATWADQVVSVRLTAERLRIVAGQETIAEHAHHFGREQLICDPWHYLPVLEKKPGALRYGAPFQDWEGIGPLWNCC
jgi:hypothetical protein